MPHQAWPFNPSHSSTQGGDEGEWIGRQARSGWETLGPGCQVYTCSPRSSCLSLLYFMPSDFLPSSHTGSTNLCSPLISLLLCTSGVGVHISMSKFGEGFVPKAPPSVPSSRSPWPLQSHCQHRTHESPALVQSTLANGTACCLSTWKF